MAKKRPTFYIVFLLGMFLADSFAHGQIKIPSRKKKIENYPCKTCHRTGLSKKYAFSPKDLEAIQKIEDHEGMIYEHMPEVWDCFLCHHSKKPNSLNLLDGTPISYNEVSTLCAQCHGIIKRDWNEGLHGKQIGSWGGEKTRSACTECHDAHHPKFPNMQAVPPQRPSERRHKY